MRHAALNFVGVGTDQSGKIQLGIINVQLMPPAQQRLRHGHHGASTQVIRIGFECESQQADPTLPLAHDELDELIQMGMIRVQRVLQQRQADALHAGE